MQKKSLKPIIKLRSDITYPDRSQHIPAFIVKIEELVLSNGKPNMRMIQDINDAGGLHEFLDTSGQVIFTFIMPDWLLERLTLDTCFYLFDEFQPDFYITMDAPTYAGCLRYSRNQIDLVLDHTVKMMRWFPDSVPIGLIKGGNFDQMDFHSHELRELGVTEFCLHAGDCSHDAPIYAQDLIVDSGRALAERVPQLMVYGVGSKRSFQRFHFANSFATNSHYIQTFNHRVIQGSTWTNFKGDFTKKIVIHNYEYLRRLVELKSDVREISEWASKTIADENLVKFSGASTLDQRIVKILEN